MRTDPDAERGGRDGNHGEHPDPDQRRERVVEQAVGDEAVAARVPEVVPELEPVLSPAMNIVAMRWSPFKCSLTSVLYCLCK